MMFELSRRLDDHIAAERERNREQQDQHRELRTAVQDLSEQTRGEFKTVREEQDKRHSENRALLRMLIAGVIIAIVTAYLNKYSLPALGIHP